jgi:hypothetical protein
MCSMNHSGGFSNTMSLSQIRNAVLVAAIVVGGSVTPLPARASADISINGRYDATSLGNWAKTNDSYHDEATVRSVWTVSSSCSDAQECNGTVSSDQGWSAPLATHDGQQWIVRHDVPNWETCGDGSTNTGKQIFMFVPVDANGNYQVGSSTLAGQDKTVGPSGACRVNKWLVVEMPFRLDRIS